MLNEDWRNATESLLRDWFGVHLPPSEFGRLFPDYATLFGLAGGTPEEIPGTPHFQHFTAALKQFADWQERERGRTFEPAEAIRAWLALLQFEAQRVGALLDAEAIPVLAWLDTQARPILGPAREIHARWAAVARGAAAHVRALIRCRTLLHECLPATVERFERALDDSTQPAISNARELFHLWGECADAAYREMAFTEHYARAFADCVDSGSRLRSAWSEWQRQGPAARWGDATRFAPPPSNPLHSTAQHSTQTTATESPGEPVAAAKATGAESPESPVRGGASVRVRKKKPPVQGGETMQTEASSNAHAQKSAPKRVRSRKPVREFDIAGISRPTGH